MWINIISITIAVVCFIILWMYKRQIKMINSQIRFIDEKDSNLQIYINCQFKEIVELIDQINKNNDYCKDKALQSENKERLFKQAITNISHDIRTPLTSLNGYFELLQETKNEQDKEKYYSIIKERIDCLRHLLEQLFTYVKLQNGEYSFELENINVKDILVKTLFTFYDDLKIHNIEPLVDIPEEEVTARLNEFAIKRVFQNIIKNSIDHGNNELSIRMKCDQDNVYITFYNPLQKGEIFDASKVFDRFYKGDATRCQTSSGLGLAITQTMIEKMYGQINAEIKDNNFYINIVLRK